MRKVISLLMAFVLCLSLCACGKSEAVKNVEALIEAIGEVTLDNEAAIVAAENAYNSLTDEEKAKVKNTEVLTAARDNYEFLLKEAAVMGSWRDFRYNEIYADVDIIFHQDGKCELSDGVSFEPAEYSFTEDGVMACGFNFIFDEIGGIPVLSDPRGSVYVREENYEALYNTVFVKIDLATVDINEYADIIQLDYKLDDFGEKQAGSTYLVISKVYEQGLIYLDAYNVVAEYGNVTTTGNYFIFGSTCDYPEFGRMRGEVIFIRDEYVDEVVFTDHERGVISKQFGIGGTVWTSSTHYLEYPF